MVARNHTERMQTLRDPGLGLTHHSGSLGEHAVSLGFRAPPLAWLAIENLDQLGDVGVEGFGETRQRQRRLRSG
jgi:hypothetical protein